MKIAKAHLCGEFTTVDTDGRTTALLQVSTSTEDEDFLQLSLIVLVLCVQTPQQSRPSLLSSVLAVAD